MRKIFLALILFFSQSAIALDIPEIIIHLSCNHMDAISVSDGNMTVTGNTGVIVTDIFKSTLKKMESGAFKYTIINECVVDKDEVRKNSWKKQLIH